MPRIRLASVAFTLLLALLGGNPVHAQEVVSPPSVVLKNIPFDLSLSGEAGMAWSIRDAGGAALASGTVGDDGTAMAEDLVVPNGGSMPLTVDIGGTAVEVSATVTSGWFSLLPPLLAILLALLFREVITALISGIWLGALAVAGFNPIEGTWRMLDTFIVPSLANPNNATIVMFSLLLGGLVGLVSKNGGTGGVVAAVVPLAKNPRRGKLATALAGFAIFFDDYANTLIVGNTMRPITDGLRVSREKLAYLVDSTAAPVAALVPISTWVGYEITLIEGGMQAAAAGAPAEVAAQLTSTSAFAVFLETIPYLFYPLLALSFVLLTSLMNRDFGPMAAAEARAANGGGLHRPGAQLTTDTEGESMRSKDGVPERWFNAAIPIGAAVAVVLWGLFSTGMAGTGPGASLMDIFGAADPFAPLLWGSFSGCVVAVVMSVGQRILTMTEAVEAFLGGMKAMVVAMTVLVLAWSLGSVTGSIGTASYLTTLLEGNVALQFLPVLVFITSAAMAFATGTSWTTMAIMIPLVIPLTVNLGGAGNFDGGTHYSILLGAISSVLAGAIFGDHCSPISDTTVLSSTAAACDHVDHVRTQLPYALVVAAVGMLLGDLGTAFGLPNWIALLGGVAVLAAILRFFGTPLPKVEFTAHAGSAG